MSTNRNVARRHRVRILRHEDYRNRFQEEDQINDGELEERLSNEDDREPELNFPPLRPPDIIRSMYRCITEDTLDLNTAARIIQNEKNRGTFSQAVYDEFVRSDIVHRVNVFKYDGLYGNPHTLADALRDFTLSNIAHQLRADILTAQLKRISREIDVSTTKDAPQTDPKVELRNCVGTWILDAPPPFAKINLQEASEKWQRRKRDTTFQQLTALFRFVLMQATDPPEKIQDYSIRMNNRGGRNGNLKDLPDIVENILVGFAEDMMGYGRDEIKNPSKVDLSNSRFYLGLGENERERKFELEILKAERKRWRPDIYRALQRALRDIRSYSYEDGTENFIWKPNNRQSKRRFEEPCNTDGFY
ncbi:hypothetical protein Y032_0488g2354 [Ancylostoma ceylanicum]|uniref:Uncharacterized protein n=1 Tax=Ancylostoma ceylanicum TaxID=53326 RepID=A0A016WUX4_9BILA|nr:hypothetical protein Y032_0488g2354 [Ancylostoma ceylanicum]